MDLFEVEMTRRFVVAVEKIANALDRKTEPQNHSGEVTEMVKDEPQRDDIGNCNICKYVGLEHRCNQCVNGSMFCKVTDEPQTDELEEPNYYNPALWE